ncbi:MAG TPA: alanine racemase [Gammaproteobacteria bacterium]|nr:alanine racemase [Gammaproteobacteria bacterium]
MYASASISQSALAHNLSIVNSFAPKANVVSMVKANAYGHQLELIQPLIDGSDLLAVSELSEVLKLRTKTDKPILLLSGIYSEDELQCAIDLNCSIVVHHATQIAFINHTQQAVNIWLKIDTGMHRLGLSSQEYADCLSNLQANPLINIECVMSHFACADEVNHPMNTTQLNHFNELTSSTTKRSMANSAAILTQTQAIFDFVRPGIMLYGASPFEKNKAGLKPVMQLSAPVMSVKIIHAGESVGYGATWVADQKTSIAIIGIGYGDGYPRHAKNGTPVLINNSLCALVGRVSMDMICVDIGDTQVSVGDNAILWGDKKLRVETVAKYSDTISYELLTNVSNRVKFISAT